MEIDEQLDRDIDHLNWALDGYVDLLAGSQTDFTAMSGNESYYCLHFDAHQLAGNENKFTDGIKKAATTLYESITTMLKRINEYFFGEGQKSAEDAADATESALDALAKVDGNTPIPADSPARNPDAIIKSLEGGTEFEEVKAENGDLGSIMDRIRASANKVKDADTVAKLRSVYAEIQSAANSGIQSVSQSLRKKLSDANSAADKLRGAKIPEEDDTAEVKAGIKSDNQEAANEAKDETKKARIIGGMRNKIVGSLNAVTKLAKGIKEKPVESAFKG